ncbi:uncharacterized protein LOC135352421 [Halichondria panicea]|uniref:uncharacterized protein LOC135352421 n=1 Tax=Halichondria panicea TaxID=6063 RepID=UPI00312B47A0
MVPSFASILTPGVDPCFICTRKIYLSLHQECWFAKEVSLGDDVTLLALPFAEDLEPSLSFKWRKRSPRLSASNKIFTEDTSSSETDLLFTDVKEVIKEIRSDWYSLAIELDIDYATRKSLEKDYRWVEPCFEAMLTHWVKRSSPPASWSALVRALESPAIARGDIATSIKTKDTSNTSEICFLTHYMW